MSLLGNIRCAGLCAVYSRDAPFEAKPDVAWSAPPKAVLARAGDPAASNLLHGKHPRFLNERPQVIRRLHNL
jgi:hypothetical protein